MPGWKNEASLAQERNDLSDLPENPNQNDYPDDLKECPRCGQKIDDILWGQTNCPRCGFHFECC
jgi:DNA-directed RNA polymerase subunit RPC12/RpoP